MNKLCHKLILCSLLLGPSLLNASEPEKQLLDDINRCEQDYKDTKLFPPANILSQAVSLNPDIIFFGENHRQGLSRFYNNSLKQISKQNSDYNCLFLEMDERLNEIIQTKRDNKKLSKKLVEILKYKRKKNHKPLC